MKIKKSLAALTATVSIMALATGCSSSGSSGVVDTQADKGLAVMGDTITYDPNHLVNDGQPIELGYWSWGDESTDPVISMLHEYEKIHPNVTFKISQVAWSDYWVKTPLSLKGNKNAPCCSTSATPRIPCSARTPSASTAPATGASSTRWCCR